MISHAWLSEKRNGKILCLACSQRCMLGEGETGICGIRRNDNSQLQLLVYGRAAAYHTDPIEKKPLYHFLPGKEILSIGTYGCNFQCSFCQNATLSQHYPRPVEYGRAYDLMPSRIVDLASAASVPAVAFTYNEPAVFFEYAFDTMVLAHEKNIKTVFVSSGYESEDALMKAAPYLDAINIDLKSFRDDFYKSLCGARLNPVLKAIRKTYELGIWLEITTLVIPGHNDSEEELRNMARFIADISVDIPYHISRFHPDNRMTDTTATPVETLIKAYNIARQEGLRYVYTGNVHDPEHSSTDCPSCGHTLIHRTGALGQNVKTRMNGNQCPHCSETIAGVFA